MDGQFSAGWKMRRAERLEIFSKNHEKMARHGCIVCIIHIYICILQNHIDIA